MPRSDRLSTLIRLLRESEGLRAEDLARATGVTPRTIYRDMELLKASGVPIEGQRGSGYWVTADICLPALNLTMDELEALHLGLAAVAQSGEPALREAAARLAARIDAALPEDGPTAEGAALAIAPFGAAARGARHQGPLRQAIRARQKLALTIAGTRRTVRPLRLDYWGRIWSCVVWDETAGAFAELRLDQIEALEVLPNLFIPEPGKRLSDFDALPNR